MRAFEPAFPSLWKEVDPRELHNLPHTEWFRTLADVDHFRVRRENCDEVGYEQVTRISDGLIVRILDLHILRNNRVEAFVPGGYVTCFFGINGGVLLTNPDGKEFKHIEGTCGVAYFGDSSVVEDFVQAGTKYTLVQVVVGKTRLKTSFLGGATPPKILASIYEKNRERAFCAMPIDAEIYRALQGIAAMNVSGKLRDRYLEAKSVELTCLIVHALHQLEQATNKKRLTKRELALLEQAKVLLTADLSAPPSLAELAQRIGMSKSSLSERFKQTYGLSIRSYLLQARMERARELLLQNDLDVNQVGWQLGYEHASSFITAFKRHYGFTPNVFRNQETRRKQWSA